MAKGKNRQIMYMFGEGDEESRSAYVRGSKGAGLDWLTRQGLPVPPGFTITTSVGRAFSENNEMPKRFDWWLMHSLRKLERASGKKLGDPKNPLIVSVRSGAEHSMPGMMDTVLNVGINRNVILEQSGKQAMLCEGFYRLNKALVLESQVEEFEDFCRRVGEYYEKNLSQFVTDEWLYLFQALSFRSLIFAHNDPLIQLCSAITAVYRSWNSKRACDYRKANALADWKNTAINIQAMVFGNFDERSATGVAFSHDLNTGKREFNGEFLVSAQGEDLVSGQVTPKAIRKLQDFDPQSYAELVDFVDRISLRLGEPADVEWTIESGKLYILQARAAKRTAIAAATLAVRKVWRKEITKKEAISLVTKDERKSLRLDEFDTSAGMPKPLACGIGASAGALSGLVVFNKEQLQAAKKNGKKAILFRHDTSPDDFQLLLEADGYVTASGGTTCHAAIVAKSLNKPAIVGLAGMSIKNEQALFRATPERLTAIKNSVAVSIDGCTGCLYLGALPLVKKTAGKELSIFLKWLRRLEGVEPRVGFEYYKQDGISLHEALNNFYLLNAMQKESEGQLKNEISACYQEYATELAERMSAYFILAIAGELRHLIPDRTKDYRSQLSKLIDFGLDTSEVYRGTVQRSVFKKIKDLGLKEHIEFCRVAKQIMEAPVWLRKSYGGKKWADIAQALIGFLDKEYGAEIFVDRAFDLRHNGGIAYDKNHMFSYDESLLQRQLDIKHAKSTVSELAKYLLRYDKKISPQVRSLLEKGEKQGIWKGA